MKQTETVIIVGLMLLAGFIGILSVLPTEAASPKVLTEISSDTTWDAAGGPYYIEQDVHVATGVKLTIDAGASVYVNGSYNFYVDGTLVVAGTSASPVLITSNFTSPSPGNWGYIRINASGSVQMDNASISYLTGIYVDQADQARFENLTVHNASWYSLYLYYSDFPILKNLYLHHTQAELVLMQNCNYANLSNIVTYNNYYRGIRLEYCDYFVMHHIRIDRCNENGVYLSGCDYSSLDNLTTTYGWGRAIYAGSCHYLKVNDAKATNFNNGWWGIYIESCDYFVLTNSSITQAPGWATQNGMYLNYCRYATLKNNYFDMVQANLIIDAWNGEEYFNHTMSNNYVRTEPIYYYKETTVNLDNVNTKHIMLFKCTASSVKNTHIANGDSMDFWYCNDVTVENCNVSDCYEGIKSIDSNRLTVKSSSTYQINNGYSIETRWGTYINITEFTSSKDNNGMLFRYGGMCRLENNTVSYASSGILLESCSFSILKNNTIYGHRDRGLFFDGGSEDYYNNTVTQDNTVNGKPAYYYFKKTGLHFSNLNAGYLGVFYCQNMGMDNLTLETTMQVVFSDNIEIYDSQIDWQRPWGYQYCSAIYMYFSNHVNISNMNISYISSYVIDISHCTHVNITDIQAYNTQGMYIYDSEYVNIIRCEFYEGNSWSVLCYYSQFLNVTNNLFYKTVYGIYIYDCDDLNVTGNTLYWVRNYYTLMVHYADRGRIYGNEITGGPSGNAYFEYCTYLNITRNFFNYSNTYGIYMYECDQCVIFLNGFISNSYNAYDTRAASNKWDNGTMGNLWSDYTGPDADQNGIGDIPYDVDGDTQDLYPLMDPFPPTIKVISHANNSFVTPGDVIQFEVSDFNLNYSSFKNDTDAWADFNPPYQAGTDSWGQGPHDIYVYADDTMGNKVTVRFHFMVDTIRPDIVMLSPGNNSMTSGTVTLDFNVLDVNLAYVESSIDGAPPAPLSAPYDIVTSPAWAEGLHIIGISAMDAAGNGRTSVFLITMDKTPPMIELVSPANQSAIEAGTPIDISVSDANLGSVQYSLNGVNYTSLLAPFDIDTSLLTGTMRIYVRASDKAGNTASAYYDFTLADSSIPQIVLFSPQDKAIIKPGFILDFGVLDNALSSVKAKIGEQAYIDLPVPFDIDTTGMSNGEVVVTIQAEDMSGNTNQKTFTFYIDTQAPDIVLLYPLDSKVNAATMIQFKIIEDVALASVYFSVNKWVLTPMPAGNGIPTTAFTEGKNTVDVVATDIAGNEARKAFEFDMDSLSPSITLLSPISGSTIMQGTPVAFEITDLHLGSVKKVTDGSAPSDLAAPYAIDTTAWADGWHTVMITAEDTFGNIATFEARFQVDLTPPVVVSTSPAQNGTGINTRPQIKIEFSEAMDTGVGGTITLTGGVSFTRRWSNSGNILYLTPTTALSYNTTYAMTLSALTDLFGNQMAEYTFDFKTALAPSTPDTAGTDDDQTTTHPPLPKNDEQIEQETTKAQKNMVWIALIVLVMIGILVAFLMIKLRKKWQSEDKMADEALWRMREKKHKAEQVEMPSGDATLSGPPDADSPGEEGASDGPDGAPGDEPEITGDEAGPTDEDILPPPMTEDTDFKDAKEFGDDKDLELDLPPPIEEEDS